LEKKTSLRSHRFVDMKPCYPSIPICLITVFWNRIREDSKLLGRSDVIV
jgi:hypothetical protein